MKNLRKILTFFILLTLASCMPDSLTKFKEAPTKKASDTTSDGGSGGDNLPPTSTCTPGTDVECTSPGQISYTVTNYETILFPAGSTSSEISAVAIFPTILDDVPGAHEQYITVAIDDTTFTDNTGLNFDVNSGDVTGIAKVFLPKTEFAITSTYSTPELVSDEITSTSITMTQATDLEKIEFLTNVSQKLIIRLDDVSSFTSQAGFNNISSPSGAVGSISYIDKDNKELHIEITSNSGSGTFSINDPVDNNLTFFTSRAEVQKVYFAFDRSPNIQVALKPIISAFGPLTTKEEQSLSYSIFPSLPSGLVFDKATGTIGTLRGYQILNDGSVSTVSGQRTVTGIGTSFTSQLQVGSVITINGEFHEVESITSDTEFATFTPLGSTATVGSFTKHIKGSLEFTNASNLIIGYGSEFTNDIVATKGLYVDAVNDFTGLTNTLVTVGNDNTLVLPAPFGGTALTIPEVTATSYTVSVKNILNKSVSTQVEMGLLDTVQPKSLTRVQYNLNAGDKIIIPTADSSDFTKDDYISNKYGAIARVNYTDPSSSNIFATVLTSGNICTDTSYTTSTACTNAEELWIAKGFDANDELDNASSFFTAETIATADSIRVFAVSTTSPVHFKQTVEPTLSATELDSLTYSIEPNISAGQGFCSQSIHKNEYDCLNTAPIGTWSQGLLFATSDQCSDPLLTTQVACTGGGETWILKGEFYGLISTSFPSTEFTVTTTNLLGRTIDTKVILSVNEAPTGLSASRSVLLHVPSYYAFEIGDAISSDKGAIGTVTGKIKSGANPPTNNVNKNTFEYYYLEVKVLEGVFSEYDDLDNIADFTAQKTYILGKGNYEYNTKVSGASTAGFIDPEYTSFTRHDNLLQVGGVDRARIVFNNEFVNTLYLNVYDTTISAGNDDPTTLTTGQTVTASNLNPTVSRVFTSIESNNIIFNSNIASFNSGTKGSDIANSTTTAVGMLHSYDQINSKSYISVTEGVFSPSENFDDESPYVGPVGTTGTISNEAAFYFYRGDKGTVNFNLDASDGATSISIDKPLPAGLSTFSLDGVISGIEGTPTGPSSKEKYTLTATNSFGSTTYQFFIKVYDHVTLTDTTGSSSYILHKTGKGNGRTPCRITDDQMNNGGIDVKDITCYLDAGEDELHWNGLKMNISVGDGMCQFIKETPYAFWKFSAGISAPATIYSHTGFGSCTIGAPSESLSSDAAGTVAVASANSLCAFDHATQQNDPSLPNCDEGTVPVQTVAWASQAFECVNTDLGNAVTSDSTAADCLVNNMRCTGGTSTGAEDEAACLALGGGAVWSSAGSDNSAGANAAGTVQVGTCSSNLTTLTDFNCGGEVYNCLSGPRTSWAELESVGGYKTGATTLSRNISVSGSSTNLTSDYTKDYDGSRLSGNSFYSNYLKACAADAYTPSVTDIQTFSSTTSSATSFLGGVTTTSLFTTTTSSKPLYTYVCTTGTGTIKARINMVVRDFDRDFKVKLGMCDDSSYSDQINCEANGQVWSALTGIDLHDPDAPLTTAAGGLGVGASDPRNFLSNNQTDLFLDPYNSYRETENSYVGGGCAAPTFDFNPLGPVQTFPEMEL